MALTITGTQAPQKLFGGLPAPGPGGVTPEITAAMPSYVDLAGILDAQNRQKALSQSAWARAAAMNNARAAQGNVAGSQGHYMPGTANQTSGMGAQYQNPATGSPTVMWAPRNLQGPQLGTWASQQQNRAVAENKEIPTIVQAHTGDPFSPNEVGGMPTSSRGLYGPGLTTAMGGMNPFVWQKMWGGSGGGGSVGETRQGGATNPFSTQSLRERTSPGPQYKYDYFGGR